MISKRIQAAAVLMFFCSGIPPVSAAPSAQDKYYQDQAQMMVSPQAQDPSAPVTPTGGPIAYSTNYDTQFSQAASFMQSPYNPNQQSRGQNSAAMNRDPLMASEVSPYSRYSPYMEVIGEGSNYSLGIDDVITILVRDQPDFSGRYVVDPEGNLQYPFVGDIKGVGKKKEEIKAEITERLRRFVRYPEVAVMISEYRSKAVFVFGYVNAPGKYAMKGDKITVKEAVVAAGLPRMDAKLNKVYVIRPSQFNKDNKPSQKKVDLDKLLNKGESTEDFLLQPGDTIVVGQRYFDKFVNNFSRLVGPVFQAAAVYDLGFGRPNGGFFGGNNKKN